MYKIDNIIEQTLNYYKKNHQRMMYLFKLIKQLDLNKVRHDIEESYFSKKEIIYRSWDDITNKAGNYKEIDILKIFQKLVETNKIKWFIHEPNGSQTFPDFRVWFNDSKNCNIDDLSEDEIQKKNNNEYINLGNDYVDFEIKTHKNNISKKGKSKYLIKISNTYVKNVNDLITNEHRLLNHLRSFNIYIGYILEDFNINDNIIKNGILRTVSINICPFIYNISKTSKKNGEIQLKKYDEQLLIDDVYSGHYDKVSELIYSFINNFNKKQKLKSDGRNNKF